MRFRVVLIWLVLTLPVLVACTDIAELVPVPESPGMLAPAPSSPKRGDSAPPAVGSVIEERRIVVPPMPKLFASPTWDAGLAQTLQDVLRGRDVRAGVVAYQLNTGRYAAYSPDAVFYAASLYKLTILYETFKQRDAGLLNLDDVVTLEARHTAQDLDTLVVMGWGTGTQLTVEDALWAMIALSDNSSAMLLAELVGSHNVDERLDDMGMHQTSIRGGELPTTAVDMVRLLTAISGGYQVTETSRREMLELLLDQRVEEGIRQSVPKGTPVGHKTGNWEDATHDVGIVWGPGGPYLLVVLTDSAYDWTAIEAVSRAVYSSLNA